MAEGRTRWRPNGWRAQLPVWLVLDRGAGGAGLGEHKGALRIESDAVRWLSGRWAVVVGRYGDGEDSGRELYGDHVTNMTNGAVVTPLNAAAYLSKLGLELSDPGNKKRRGERSGRSPLEIASDYEECGRARDGWLWRHYCAAMKGARQLTWSRGLKRKFNIIDRTDQEVAQDEEPSTAEEVVIAELPAEQWACVRAERIGKTCGPYYVIQCAERDGAPGVRKAVRRLCAQHMARLHRRA